jgi:hypothetical protein
MTKPEEREAVGTANKPPIQFQIHLLGVEKARGNDPGLPQTAQQRKPEIHRILTENHSDNDANVDTIGDQ